MCDCGQATLPAVWTTASRQSSCLQSGNMPAGRIRCGRQCNRCGRQCNRQHKVSTPCDTTGGTPCDTTGGTPCNKASGDTPCDKASDDMVSNMIISTTSDMPCDTTGDTPCDTTGGTPCNKASRKTGDKVSDAPCGAASKAAGKSAVNYSAQDAR